MSTIEIQKRYSTLADDSCCLSCGGAINYSEPREGEVCVDLGSGRGTDAIRLAESVGKTGMVYGIDISEGMIAKAKQNADKLGITNVKFIQNELEQLDIESNTVDLIISNCTLNHAKDKLAVWSEIYRILKNKGRFVVSDIFSIQEVPDEYKNDPVAVAECWAGAIRKDYYLAVLQKAGFKKINIIEESAPYPKGKIEVSSWTISGTKDETKCSCCCS